MSHTLEQCLTLHQEKAWHAAELAYQNLLKKEPENHQLNHLMGVLYLQINKTEQAITFFKKAIKLHKEEPSYFNNLANAYQKSNQLQEAEKAYQTALTIEATNLISLNNLANLYQKKKRYSESLNLYIKAAHLEPGNLDTHYALGLLFIKLSREIEAITQFKNVLTLDECHLNAHFYLGTLYLNSNQLKKAKPHFQSVLTLDSEHCDALVNLGTLHLKQGRAQLAIDTFAKALAYNNDSIEAQNNLAATFMTHERYQNAVPHYEDLLKKDSNNTEYLYNLGVACMNTSAATDAKKLFKKLIKIVPTHASAHINLAAIYSREENKTQTAIYLKKAIEIDSNDHASTFMLHALENKPLQNASTHYVKQLFNSYAPHYEQHLKKELDYQLPTKFKDTLRLIFPSARQTANILDLGVGTGLLGQTLKQYAKYLAGIDLSEKMLALAKEKNFYDELLEQEIISYLKETPHAFDLIIAGDVLPYFGELDTLFNLLPRALSPTGHCILSIEKAKITPFKLQTTGRFCHHPDYLEKLAKKANLTLIESKDISLRNDKNSTIEGCLMTFQKSNN